MKTYTFYLTFFLTVFCVNSMAIVTEMGRSWSPYFRCADAIKAIVTNENPTGSKPSWQEALGKHRIANGEFGEAASIYLQFYRREVQDSQLNKNEARLKSLRSLVIYGALLSRVDSLKIYKIMTNDFGISFFDQNGSIKSFDQFVQDLNQVAPEFSRMISSKDDSYGSLRVVTEQLRHLLANSALLQKTVEQSKKHMNRKRAVLMQPLLTFKAELERRYGSDYTKNFPFFASNDDQAKALFAKAFTQRNFLFHHEAIGFGAGSSKFIEMSNHVSSMANSLFNDDENPKNIYRYTKNSILFSRYNGLISGDLIEFIESAIDEINLRYVTYDDLEVMAERMELYFKNLLDEEAKGYGDLKKYFDLRFSIEAEVRLFQSQHQP